MKTKVAAIVLGLVALPLFAWRVAPVLSGFWGELFSRPTVASAEVVGMERVDLTDPAYREWVLNLEPGHVQYGMTEFLREHIAQYRFAVEYSKAKGFQSVADIASGTCYGMEMLREVVPNVDGYDKLDLCGNYVVDLDKEDWGRKYDAIVSFETLEHLRRPEFFLANAARSAAVLIISTVVNETPGGNPHHVSYWKPNELLDLLGRFYSCELLHRVGQGYEPGLGDGLVDFFAVCTVLG